MKKFFLGLLSLYLFAANLSALIIRAPDLEEFEKAVEKSNQESLVLFDVDETLIVPKDAILRCDKERCMTIARKILEDPQIVPPGKYGDHYFLGQVLSQIKYEVVDPKIISVIDSLQKREIKAIAFTNMRPNSCGVITSLADWRIGELKKHQIDFSGAFPSFSPMEVDLPNGKPAFFKQGVLYVNEQDKGPVLSAFLSRLEWGPSKVIFIDNRLECLQSVDKVLQGTGIDFIGFFYTAIEDNLPVIDEELAYFQFMHLAKSGVWLNDQEARELLPIK